MPPAKRQNSNSRKMPARLSRGRVERVQLALSELPDHGPIERWQHSPQKLVRLDPRGAEVARAMVECQLDALFKLGVIGVPEHQAGLVLRRAFVRARLHANQIMRYVPRVVKLGGAYYQGFERSEREELAYKDWRLALDAAGQKSAEALVTVCCLDLRPSAPLLRPLHDGLERLVQYYKVNLHNITRR